MARSTKPSAPAAASNSSSPASTTAITTTSSAPRPILRKKKSVTFHPSTKPSSPRQSDDATTFPTAKSATGGLEPYSALPPWRKDNAFILHHHRPVAGSHIAALPSLFGLHNETCNIWSHLLGLIFFASFGTWFLLSGLDAWYPTHTKGDVVAFAAFFAGTCTCLTASASYHLFAAVGEAQARAWNGVDYAGIVACVWGSFVACLHFGLPDDHDLAVTMRYPDWHDVGRARRRIYEAMISGLAVACTLVSVLPQFRTPEWRSFRAAMFVAMGLSAVFPVLHGLQIYGWEQLERQMSLSWVILQGALYITGAALYAVSVGEDRFWLRWLADHGLEPDTGAFRPWQVRSLRCFASDLPCTRGTGSSIASCGPAQGLSLRMQHKILSVYVTRCLKYMYDSMAAGQRLLE